jgi:hypothetical protein
MPISVQTSGGWQPVTNVFYNIAGTWHNVINAWLNVSGTWRRIFGQPLTVTVSSTTAFGQYTGGGAGTATTYAVTASAVGGAGGYSYLWQYVSGDSSTSVNSGSSATTTWSRSATEPAGPFTSNWVCQVTDSAGNIGYSPNVGVTTLFT